MQRSAHLLIGLVAVMVVPVATACSSTKIPLPPPFKGSAVDNPVSCSQLQTGKIVGEEIHLEGGIPNCGATGLECPLPGVSPAVKTSVCGSLDVVAMCEQDQWKLTCTAAVDASAPAEAGDASTQDAQADASQD